MASIALTGALPKFLQAGPAIARKAPAINMRVLVTGAVPPNPLEGNDAKIETAGDAQKAATDSRGVATATNQIIEEEEIIEEEAHTVASQVIGTAQELSEKAKQTVQDAWGSAKDTAQKVKDTVVGKAEDARACIKENAEEAKATVKENTETIKKAMNTKN